MPANGLMRMFGPSGNPSTKNSFGVLAPLQAQEGVNFELRPRRGPGVGRPDAAGTGERVK